MELTQSIYNIFIHILGECEEPEIVQKLTHQWVAGGISYVSVDVSVTNHGSLFLMRVSLMLDNARIDNIWGIDFTRGMLIMH